MPYFPHFHRNRFGHGGSRRFGFGHGGHWGHHRPWLFHRHGFPGGAPDGDDDGNADPPPPPPPPPQFPFPLPFPLPNLEMGEAEAERRHRRHRRADDDEMSLNDDPYEPPSREGRQSGRWIRSKGRLILLDV
jgi:hypothetical protein